MISRCMHSSAGWLAALRKLLDVESDEYILGRGFAEEVAGHARAFTIAQLAINSQHLVLSCNIVLFVLRVLIDFDAECCAHIHPIEPQ